MGEEGHAAKQTIEEQHPEIDVKVWRGGGVALVKESQWSLEAALQRGVLIIKLSNPSPNPESPNPKPQALSTHSLAPTPNP